LPANRPAGRPGHPALLPGVDRAAFATSLSLRLRAAGIDVGLTAVETFARALVVSPPVRRTALYWTARLTLVRRSADLVTFDAVFDAVFADAVVAVDPAARRQVPRSSVATPVAGDRPGQAPTPQTAGDDGPALPWVRLPTVVGTSPADDTGPDLPQRRPTVLEAIADVPFAQLDAAELARLEALLDDLLAQARRDWPTRPSRRMADHAAGQRISLRRTLAHARRTGFEPVRLHRDRAVRKPRRLVMLCDVSQSMQPYAAAYLHLMRAAAMLTRSEVFAFSTSLTRLTAVLAHRSPEVAMGLAGERVTDRFGGTRIASNLRALLASHHGSAVRGSIVIIASDGWDGDDPQELAAAMARLRRRAHRVIWLNPRAAAPGFAPTVGAVAAALPYCDAMLPAMTARDLVGVVEAVTRSGAVSSRA
jgi:uncharacterized protein with von Willebrand factor type A (vWA) domain